VEYYLFMNPARWTSEAVCSVRFVLFLFTHFTVCM